MKVMPTFPSGEAGAQLRRMLWPMLGLWPWPGGTRGIRGIRGRQSPPVPARCPLRGRTQRWHLWLCCQPGAACVPWCQGAARCPQSPSWLQRAPATSALADTLGVTWVTVLRAPGGPGVAAGGSPRLHKDITNRPHDSFITPWGQSVWETGRPLTPADGRLNHRRLRLDFTTADPQQSPFQAVWGWACFALPELQEQFQQFGPKEAASM